MSPSAMAATLNKSRRFMKTMTISPCEGNIRRQLHPNRLVNNLMLALAHAARCRLKGARLKSRDDLFGAADGFDENHRYSTSLERRNGARPDAAAQHGPAIPQCVDKPGVAVLFSDTITRSASVPMAACVDAGLDELHLPVLGFENEKLAAAAAGLFRSRDCGRHCRRGRHAGDLSRFQPAAAALLHHGVPVWLPAGHVVGQPHAAGTLSGRHPRVRSTRLTPVT